jgi:putative membrane protein
MGYHGAWMGLWGLIVLAVWLAPLVLLYSVLNRPRPPHDGVQRSARDVLDEAYARGAISREEYLQKRADLGSG